MTDFILTHESMLRASLFLLVFALMAAWERRAPRRTLSQPRLPRWGANIGMVFLNTLILRLLFPIAAAGVALMAANQGWGILNWLDLPPWLAIMIAVVLLDLAIYLQHVMVHALPTLWRLHRVHHADLDFDVTTGARFHPLEIIISMLIKFTVILLLGPSAVAVLIFEVLLNATAMFNHANIRIPVGIDRWLRWLLVTPDMHRVHHSVEDDETNSNFGFCLPWWDHLLGTYRAQPRGGHEAMRIGIQGYRDPKQVARLPGMLALPFIGKVKGYSINRRQWGDGSHYDSQDRRARG